ncbi:MAG: hypothetical protein KKH08_03030, partial [Candidatus Omnitrophica bacterium]|nr:hypothetical protein [Candidatus Omnitrophota bacterium]
RLEMFFKSWVKYIFYLLLIIIYMISSVQAFDGAKQNRYSRPVHELQIEAGVWMRENVAQEGKLIVAEPIIPYFFYKKTPNNYERLPYGEYKSLVDYMKFSKSKYLAIFSWMREDNPAVNFLFNHNDPVELQLLKSLNKDSHTVLIYELGNENLTTEKSMTGINEN